MKQRSGLKFILCVFLIFIALTGAAAILDDGWLEKTFSSIEGAGGWILGGLFGAIILFYLGKGIVFVLPIMIIRFGIGRLERRLLLVLFLAGMVYLASDGFIDSSAALAAALLMSVLAMFALFWLWRRLRGIAERILYGDGAYNTTNLEYFGMLAASLALALLLVTAEPGTVGSEDIGYTILVVLLLLIVFAVCLYWGFVFVKSAFRAGKYRGRLIEYIDKNFVFYGSTRTFRIPLDSIQSLQKIETYAGLAAIPTRFTRPKTTTMLVIGTATQRTPLSIPWPGEEAVQTLREIVGGTVSFTNQGGRR
ncbi:MAG: hypothetical protein AAGU74_12330 [Bacillota bacterium]